MHAHVQKILHSMGPQNVLRRSHICIAHSVDFIGHENTYINAQYLGDIGAVGRGASHARISGEANLVVNHNVNGAMCGIVGQVR